MRIVQVVRMFALCTLLVTAAWVYAQDAPKPDEPRPEAAKPAQQDEKPARQDEAKPATPDDNKRDDKAMKQDDKGTKQDDAKSKQGSPVAAQSGQEQRGGNQRGARIPDDKFRANFGHEHKFVMHRTTVQGRPGFQYGGYSFILVDPWPADWAYTDDCYVDYIDGEYFLFDLAHPGVQIALTLVM
ncbi:MAG: hypothetical protein WB566_10415 [Terriglobales bacterium]